MFIEYIKYANGTGVDDAYIEIGLSNGNRYKVSDNNISVDLKLLYSLVDMLKWKGY